MGKYSGVSVVSWEMGLIPISYGPRPKVVYSSLYHGRPILLYQKKLGVLVGDFEWSGIYCEPPCCLRRTSEARGPSPLDS